MEEHSEPLLEENEESEFGENIESSPHEGVEEVDSTKSQDFEVEQASEVEEFLDDKSDESFEKSADVVDEKSNSHEGESLGKSEAQEVNEEFAGDDEILEEDQEESSDLNGDEDQEIFDEESEETETVEDSQATEKSQSTGETEEVSEHTEEAHLEPSKEDEFEELSPASEEVEAEKVEDLSETSEFHDELKNAMENAIKENPNVKTIMVIKYDKDDKHPEIQHVDVDDYKEEFYERQEHHQPKSVEDILTESISGGNGAEIKPAIEGPIMGDERVSDKIIEEAETLIKPSEDASGQIQNALEEAQQVTTHELHSFENVSFQDALNHQDHHNHNQIARRGVKKMAGSLSKSDEIKEAGTQAQDVYLTSHEKMHNALKLFAEHDAFKRATVKIPRGIPANVFLADFMGVSGVGEHKPSYNMIKFYGGLSEFHQHFANKATRQVSFEDIDTLIGLLSDMNGIFTTIYDLLPTKDEIEGEKENNLGKSILDHAYDILRFYSQVRGFVNTVVFNRHLLIQDIRFIKSRVNDLHTDMDDMLYFYALDADYLKVKTRGTRFNYDPKIEAFLKRIDNVSVGFGVDVKKVLRTFFNFEKAVVFFDTDTRELSMNINVSTPLDAIRTVDRVIMFLIRIIELKIEIFRSLKELKNSLENLGKYRTEILENLRGAEQLIHYYALKEEGVSLVKFGSFVALMFLFFRKD